MAIHKCKYFNEITQCIDLHPTFMCAECNKQWIKVLTTPRHTHILENEQLKWDYEYEYKFIVKDEHHDS